MDLDALLEPLLKLGIPANFQFRTSLQPKISGFMQMEKKEAQDLPNFDPAVSPLPGSNTLLTEEVRIYMIHRV